MGLKARTTKARTETNKFPDLLHLNALDVMKRTLSAMRHSDKVLVRGTCSSCLGAVGDSRCALCAVVEQHGLQTSDIDAEFVVAELLLVPHEWVMQFIAGWDGDCARPSPFRRAHASGKKLADKFKATFTNHPNRVSNAH